MRLTTFLTLCLCCTIFGAAPAAAGDFVPDLQWSNFRVKNTLRSAATTASFFENNPARAVERILDPSFAIKKRQKKKGKHKKKHGKKPKHSSSGHTLEYGALSGRVAPMDKFLGVGLQLGAPTGVTGKFMFDSFGLPQLGIVGGLGAGVGWVNTLALSITLDLVYHPHVLARSDSFRLSWYIGGGLWMGVSPLHVFAFSRGAQESYLGFNYLSYFGVPWYGTSLGLRMPLGVSLALKVLPIEIYAEVTPAILVFPAIGGGIGGSVGLRFWL